MADIDIRRVPTGAAAAVREMFAAQSRPLGRTPEDDRKILQVIQLLTGGLGSATPGSLEMQIRRINAMTGRDARKFDQYLKTLENSTRSAGQFGLSRQFAAKAAQSASAFGQAFGDMAGRQGAGGLSKEEAESLDSQLRLAAASSPMANSLGALMKLDAQGLVRTDPGKRMAKAIKDRRTEEILQMANMSPRQILDVLQQSGVSPALATQALQNQIGNREFIDRYGIQDLVRQMQGQGEIAGIMNRGLQQGMVSVLREVGLDRHSSAAVATTAAEAARKALMGMHGDMLSDPEKMPERNSIVANAIASAVGPQVASRLGRAGLTTLASSAIEGLEGFMGRSAALSRFKNVAGLVTMNRGDIIGRGHRNMAERDAAADLASMMSGVNSAGPLAAAMDQIQRAGNDNSPRVIELVSTALGIGADKRSVAVGVAGSMRSIRDASAEYLRVRRRGDEPAARVQADAIRRQVTEVRELATANGINLEAAGLAAGPAPVGPPRPGMPASSPVATKASLHEMRQRDKEVKAQESLHAAIAGKHASQPQYTYATGSDGKKYATGGSVAMDVTPVPGDHAATISKMDTIEAAARAPSRVSGAGLMSSDDHAVASQAARLRKEAGGRMTASSPPGAPAASATRPQPASADASGAEDKLLQGLQAALTSAFKDLRIRGTLEIHEDDTAELDAGINNIGAAAAPSAM